MVCVVCVFVGVLGGGGGGGGGGGPSGMAYGRSPCMLECTVQTVPVEYGMTRGKEGIIIIIVRVSTRARRPGTRTAQHSR